MFVSDCFIHSIWNISITSQSIKQHIDALIVICFFKHVQSCSAKYIANPFLNKKFMEWYVMFSPRYKEKRRAYSKVKLAKYLVTRISQFTPLLLTQGRCKVNGCKTLVYFTKYLNHLLEILSKGQNKNFRCILWYLISSIEIYE